MQGDSHGFSISVGGSEEKVVVIFTWLHFSTGFSNSICSKQNLIPLKWMELKVHIPSCLCRAGEWSSLNIPSVYSRVFIPECLFPSVSSCMIIYSSGASSLIALNSV